MRLSFEARAAKSDSVSRVLVLVTLVADIVLSLLSVLYSATQDSSTFAYKILPMLLLLFLISIFTLVIVLRASSMHSFSVKNLIVLVAFIVLGVISLSEFSVANMNGALGGIWIDVLVFGLVIILPIAGLPLGEDWIAGFGILLGLSPNIGWYGIFLGLGTSIGVIPMTPVSGIIYILAGIASIACYVMLLIQGFRNRRR